MTPLTGEEDVTWKLIHVVVQLREKTSTSYLSFLSETFAQFIVSVNVDQSEWYARRSNTCCIIANKNCGTVSWWLVASSQVGVVGIEFWHGKPESSITPITITWAITITMVILIQVMISITEKFLCLNTVVITFGFGITTTLTCEAY